MKNNKKMKRLDIIVLMVGVMAVVGLIISFSPYIFFEPEDSYVDFDNPYSNIEESYGENIDRMSIVENIEINEVVNVYYLKQEENGSVFIDGIFHDIFFKVDNKYYKVVGGSGNLQVAYIYNENQPIRIIRLSISGKHNISVDTNGVDYVEITDSYGNSGTRVTNEIFSYNIFVYDELDENYHIKMGNEIIYFNEDDENWR